MPTAKLPSTPKGWIIALIASMVGFMAGLATIDCLNKMWR